MGTIVERARANGSTAFLAKISITRNGKIAHRENKTFDRRAAAAAWIAKREEELRAPGEIERAKTAHITLADAIDKYTTESRGSIGRTKTQVLNAIKAHPIADMPCGKISSPDIVSFARDLSDGRKPQTVANYLSHLSAVFTIAGPAWGYALDPKAMSDAFIVAKRLRYTKKSAERNRRPTLDELDRIMTHYEDRQRRRPSMAPMLKIVAFALFSTRRQEEITRIAWADLDEANSRVLVRDMKNPGDKSGNHVWCDLPPEALEIIQGMPKAGPLIFPYTADAISASFTRATAFLGIADLTFHDLRHEGVTRLFEMGRTIPQVASVSGHRSWQNLKRYTHIRQAGDKYAGWKWFDLVNRPMPIPIRMLPSAPCYGGPSPEEQPPAR
ncbi:MAG: site-specific integrase [Sphingomonas sp.]|uniref:tyrosine-type recombinase/integrase n=1 Tax=Sphingomonas sp. TaxID=28214 RepID=UPI0026283F63|nr:site-specific integrase [Sphingomonas sp.]MDK2769946.1 site-specific integrase [Sphingomonas sp.]